MGLPDVLDKAGGELRSARAAWLLVEAAATLLDDETMVRQYVDETLYAVRRAAALLDEWFVFGDTPHAETQGPF